MIDSMQVQSSSVHGQSSIGTMKLSTLVFLAVLSTNKITVESTKLSATILNSALREDTVRHSVIYDGNDSIFIFADSIGRKDNIFCFNITTSSVTVAGEMPDVGETRLDTGRTGYLAWGGFGNILYFGGGRERRDVCKFNQISRLCENVSTLLFDPTYSSIVHFKETHILIFGGFPQNCQSVYSFNLNTYESIVVKNTSSNLCGALVVKNANKAVIHDNNNEALSVLDLETFAEKRVAEDLFKLNIFSSFTRNGNDLYILKGFERSGLKQDYKHGIIKLDLESFTLSILPIEGFILTGKEYFTIPPAAVFVEKLNRIYLFGGVSTGRFSSLVYHTDIWYIDLNPGSNTYLWFLFAGMLAALVVAGGIITYFIRKKVKKVKTPPKIKFSNLKIERNQTTPTKTTQLTIYPAANRVWKSCNPFELVSEEPFGSGSFSEVYKARHALNSNLYFAIKKIKVYKSLQNMEWEIEKVLREFVNLSVILNPNVVRMWNCWMEDEHGKIVSQNAIKLMKFKEWSSTQDYFLFLQMEFCDSTLRDWLTENKTLEQRMAKDVKGIMWQIVNGLRGIHEKGIIHRDIKPNNIFYCETGNLWKIGDLGLSAKGTDSSGEEHTVAGCKLYRSPEMNSNGAKTANYSFKSDVFSLGLAFFEMVCIFQSEVSCLKIFQQIRNADGKISFQKLEGLATLPNSNLLELVATMLVKNPADRIDIFDSSIDPTLSGKHDAVSC